MSALIRTILTALLIFYVYIDLKSIALCAFLALFSLSTEIQAIYLKRVVGLINALIIALNGGEE